MEATREDMGLLKKIQPPKLEDAGLEDCALPLHSIQEAFLKAASAVGSRVSDSGCVSDPSPRPPSDALAGVASPDGVGPCAGEKGNSLVGDGGLAGKDLVIGGTNEGKGDDVVVSGGGASEDCGGCVDGISDLKIKDSDIHGSSDDDDDGEKDKKQPILVEGYLLTP